MTFRGATTQADFQQIIALQAENLERNVSQAEAISQGFVTVCHTKELIEAMNFPFPHAIATDQHQVVGYALMMTKAFAKEIPVLLPMFELIDQLSFEGKALKTSLFFVMGQVCIQKEYRGQGLFKGLYQQLINQTKADFDYMITEIASRNLRSMKAHTKIGFSILHTYTDNEEEWTIVILELKKHR